MLNASVDMLRHLGHDLHADAIADAIYKTICVDRMHTKDFGGDATSSDVVNCILKHLSGKHVAWWVSNQRYQISNKNNSFFLFGFDDFLAPIHLFSDWFPPFLINFSVSSISNTKFAIIQVFFGKT